MADTSREAHCRLSLAGNRGDQFLINGSGQHHERNVARFGICNPQTMDKVAFLAQLAKHASERASSPVNHSHLMPGLGEFHNSRRTTVENLGILQSAAPDFYNDSHCSPSSSGHPYI